MKKNEQMIKRNTEPNVALFVDDFLPYTHAWIYRQVADPVTCVKTVLCLKRSEEIRFPFLRHVVGIGKGRLKEYIRGRFWFLFKYRAQTLSKSVEAGFERELMTQEINLVHAHFGTNGVLIAPLCERLGIPLIVTFHGFDISSAPLRWPAYYKKLQLLFKQITYAIAISEEMAVRLKALGCPEHKIKISYLGVPLSEFVFVERTTHAKPLVFLHAGRLTAKKGVPDLVSAFAQAFREEGNAELWIAGDGEELEKVHEAIRLSKPVCKVKLLGRLSDDDLQEVRSLADVFVINCRVDSAGTQEGLPISILEACATGMPVITTRHAGIPEAVKQNETGILVDELDNEALAAAMKKMQESDFRLTLGRQAREYMTEKFALLTCNEKLRLLYDMALTH